MPGSGRPDLTDNVTTQLSARVGKRNTLVLSLMSEPGNRNSTAQQPCCSIISSSHGAGPIVAEVNLKEGVPRFPPRAPCSGGRLRQPHVLRAAGAMSPVNRGGQMIFTDDLIVNANGDIGMVERAPNSSDEDSEVDDDIIDDEQDSGLDGKLPPGSARVRWRADDQLKTELMANLQLSDRVFLMGDIVARASNQLGQTGIVVGMRMYCDVRSGGDDLVLRRVPTRLLQPLAACRPGALVVHPQALRLGLG